MEDKKDVCDEPLEHLLQHDHEFSEELSDGGERNELAEQQEEEPSNRKRIRTG
ncbi:hypothetical protein JCM9140_1144 [Halalkalibacter wakoensis JCM 9140]|uniref:Uncharacterized protein n=1 Tax=Halalkalibacter wakoensis JCM 9140 TaxID=1236970 RepID=W4PZA0_9BACI|nr:hypothetical protein [Halalkalibacter wakoensis]GAE25166.1 hypothetical protein JCM9140_1144 [Halalkalibacter wakoensis JCM 9140]